MVCSTRSAWLGRRGIACSSVRSVGNVTAAPNLLGATMRWMLLLIVLSACRAEPTLPPYSLVGDCTRAELSAVSVYSGDTTELGSGVLSVDPPRDLPVGRITDLAAYEVIQGYVGRSLGPVEFTQNAVLFATAWAPETCGFSDSSLTIFDRNGQPVLLASAIDPTGTCTANCPDGQVYWAAVQVPLTQEGSACGLVVQSCVVTEE